jgi:predicted DCC family thiol-disulfide oxidoreductase YuxK
MRQRYLLFDSGCSVCTRLAEDIERASDGWLAARSLRDPDVKTLLDAAQPGWRWEPTLLEVTDGRPRVFTGIAMRARMALGLGPRRAWRVLQVMQRVIVPQSVHAPVPTARRRFLQRTGTFAGLLFIPRLNKNHLTPQSGTALRILSADEIAPLMPLITSSQSYRHFLAQLGKTALPDQPFALGQGSTVYATIPLTIDDQKERGFFSAALQIASTGIASMREAVALYRQDISQGRKVRLWLNSQLVSEAIFDYQGTIVEGWVIKEQQRVDVTGQNLVAQGRIQSDTILQQLISNSTAQDCYGDCSNRCSVPNDIAGAAALLCAAACVASLGAACIACATLAAGVYAYNVACCLYKCYVAPAMPCCGG